MVGTDLWVNIRAPIDAYTDESTKDCKYYYHGWAVILYVRRVTVQDLGPFRSYRSECTSALRYRVRYYTVRTDIVSCATAI